MKQADLTGRIETLERDVEAWQVRFDTAFGSLQSQISQLRDEMHEEFSAVRREIAAGDDESIRSLREEIRAGDEETRRVLREEIRAGDEETRRVLREEIRAGDDETRHLMRVLHEEVLERIAKLGEAS